MGEVISGRQMTSVPLDGRSYTDLLALQPGVAPETSITSDTVQDVGATVLYPSGTLNPGTISVNGQREFANVFIVNGANAEEDVNEGTAIYKCTNDAPVGDSKFSTFEGLPSDHYLKLVGAASKMIRGDVPLAEDMPALDAPKK